MATTTRDAEISERLAQGIREFIDAEATRLGSTKAVNPGHRIPFQWPPHPVSYNYHVLASDWRGSIEVDLFGESFTVLLAKTHHGVFGRSDVLWAESKGKSEAEVVENLRAVVEPLFRRQREIASTIGMEGRFQGSLADLDAPELLKLLYCCNRDVASNAQTILETRKGKPNLLPSLLTILKDSKHPNRRSAQWCVLDLFEDMPSYCTGDTDEFEAIAAIKSLISTAEDDYARTIYKAGVVLGGHLPDLHGGPALIECLSAPSKIGRRSAIHGLFHVAEWHPEMREEVVRALTAVSKQDSDPQLRVYAEHMAQDIASEQVEHVEDPIFPEES